MTKQSFPIPEGYKAVTMEQVGNQIITTFEPVFKRGDVVMSKSRSVFVVDEITGDYIYEIVGILPGRRITFRSRNYFTEVEGLRHATPEEAQQLWDALAKDGKRWNPGTMQVEEIKKDRWRAEFGKDYYCFYWDMNIVAATECGDITDNLRYNSGNYFRTPKQAERAEPYIQKALDDFWKEELK